ncbi:MAG: formylglycine-generating enzyme family protein [Myxococcota bacterium]|nr:formylglycine-generating enzyme family protein [Myxococcota bacterium]
MALLLFIGISTGVAAPVSEGPAESPAVLPCGDTPSGMSCIPGGPFIMGSDSGVKSARPAHQVWLQSYFLDQNEVTVAAYKRCMRRGRCEKAGPRYADFSRPKQPINGVSWFHAKRYCEVQGKHLPTEAEWEKGARGEAGDPFPWGTAPATCERAIIKGPQGRSCGVRKRGNHPEKGRVWVVGSRPAGRYGLFDMAGNSYEWVADWHSPSYARCGEACAGINPRGPCDGAARCPKHYRRVVKGGSWYWPAAHALGYHRRAHFPKNEPFHHFGFRCAASLEEAAQLLER